MQTLGSGRGATGGSRLRVTGALAPPALEPPLLVGMVGRLHVGIAGCQSGGMSGRAGCRNSGMSGWVLPPLSSSGQHPVSTHHALQVIKEQSSGEAPIFHSSHRRKTVGSMENLRAKHVRKHGLHCYADDTQLYIKTAPKPSTALSSRTSCLEEIKAWMNNNPLQLNSNKTEALLIGTPH